MIVLQDGGQLWIPALAIAVLYAACAVLIRDPLFAYAMVGGITLTGLMILGDQSIAKFWQGGAVSSLLIAIGAIAIHSERAFIPGTGVFNRKDFGVAFYRGGHGVLLGGIIVLVIWSISAWTYDGMLFDVWRLWQHRPIPFDQPQLATSLQLKSLAMLLSLISTYLYGYSYIVVTRRKAWILGGVMTFLLAKMMFIDALPTPVTYELVMMALATTAICFQVFSWSVRSLNHTKEKGWLTLMNLTQAITCLLLITPLVFAIAGYLRFNFNYFKPYEFTPVYAAAVTTTALACCLGCMLTRGRMTYLNATYAIGSCVAFLLAAYSGLTFANLKTWDTAGPLLMLIPRAYLWASRRFKSSTRLSLEIASQFGAGLLTLVTMVTAYGITLRRIEPLTGQTSEVMLSLFLAELCVFYGLYLIVSKRYAANFPALLAGSAALVQLGHFLGASHEIGLFTFGAIGLGGVRADRLLALVLAGSTESRRSLSIGGQILLSLAGAGGVLLALNRLMVDGFHGGTLALLLGMIAISLLAAVLVVSQEARRWYVSLAIAQACSIVLLIAFGLALEPWQKLELLCAALGIFILIVSHVGWAQEGENRDNSVTFGLFVGSLLWAVPLMIGLLGQRFDFYSETTPWRMVHEIGALSAGLILMGTGILFRIRSTTIVGTTAILLYLGTLVVYVRLPEQLRGVAIYMMIGGGVFLVVSMLLSIFRDYLLALPDRFRRRRGLFRVLTWR